jgi:hypothetical protein
MSEPQRLIYTPRPEATPESEAAALSAVYRFVLFDRMRALKETGVRSPQSDSKKEVSDEPSRK